MEDGSSDGIGDGIGDGVEGRMGVRMRVEVGWKMRWDGKWGKMKDGMICGVNMWMSCRPGRDVKWAGMWDWLKGGIHWEGLGCEERWDRGWRQMLYEGWTRMGVSSTSFFITSNYFIFFSTCLKGGGWSFPVKAQLAHSAHGSLPTSLLHSLTSSDRSFFFCLQSCVSFLDNSFLCISSFYFHRFVCLLSVPCARSHTVYPSDFDVS